MVLKPLKYKNVDFTLASQKIHLYTVKFRYLQPVRSCRKQNIFGKDLRSFQKFLDIFKIWYIGIKKLQIPTAE